MANPADIVLSTENGGYKLEQTKLQEVCIRNEVHSDFPPEIRKFNIVDEYRGAL